MLRSRTRPLPGHVSPCPSFSRPRAREGPGDRCRAREDRTEAGALAGVAGAGRHVRRSSDPMSCHCGRRKPPSIRSKIAPPRGRFSTTGRHTKQLSSTAGTYDFALTARRNKTSGGFLILSLIKQPPSHSSPFATWHNSHQPSISRCAWSCCQRTLS
jgi:hypothetical protein